MKLPDRATQGGAENSSAGIRPGFYWSGLLSGIVAQVLAMVAFVAWVGPGHGSTTVAKVLFPLTMVVGEESGALASILGIYSQIQYVVYGLCIGATLDDKANLAWAWIPFTAHALAWLWLLS